MAMLAGEFWERQNKKVISPNYYEDPAIYNLDWANWIGTPIQIHNSVLQSSSGTNYAFPSNFITKG